MKLLEAVYCATQFKASTKQNGNTQSCNYKEEVEIKSIKSFMIELFKRQNIVTTSTSAIFFLQTLIQLQNPATQRKWTQQIKIKKITFYKIKLIQQPLDLCVWRIENFFTNLKQFPQKENN
ncbi:unnamed protein product [Paramecium sonneborni]|uniref:Uncharacterized protein n=1 Tax=Paramecium sonneborni TaxID=65129 RepID=A0A8S1RV69_9CILI|nr:unnamed protein product [Paramecium sonneborni]